jgi:hypothetical protein
LGRDITLSWDAAQDPRVTGYKLYYGSNPRSYDKVITVGNATTYQVTDLGTGPYYFAVTAYYNLDVESPFSNEVPQTGYYPGITLPSSYAPNDVSSTVLSAGVAFVNLNSVPCEVRMTAVGNSGTPVSGPDIRNPVGVTLAPRRHLAQMDYQWFGSGLLTQDPPGLVRIEGTTGSINGIFLYFDDRLTMLDGGGIRSVPLADAVLTEVEGQGFNRVYIHNPNAEAATVTLNLVPPDGSPQNPVTRNISISGGGVYSGEIFGDIFPGLTPLASNYLRINSTRSVFSSQLTGKPSSYINYLDAHDAHSGSSRLYSPQYVTGGGWRTELSIVNLDTKPDQITLRLVGDDGMQIGRTAGPLTIEGHGKIHLDDPNLFHLELSDPEASLITGYVEIAGNGTGLAGSIVFGDLEHQIFSTALPLVSEFSKSFVFSQIASNETWFTGIALFNPNPAASDARMEVYDPEGIRIFSKTERLQPFGRVSKLVTEFFPDMKDLQINSGYLRISCDNPMSGVAVIGTNDLSALSAALAQTAF